MKFEKITNPLTIVAAFCSISEIAAVSVLPKLSENLQGIFLWFVMAFPVMLLLLFFVTWNFNHRVLYAPSDFRDENLFLSYAQASTAETVEQINDAVKSNKIDSNTAEALKISLSEFTEMIDRAASDVSKSTEKISFLMSVLISNPDGLTLNEISAKLGSSKAYISRLLKEGINQGYITKKLATDTLIAKYQWSWGD